MHRSLLKNFSFLTISNVLMPIASMALVVAISRLGGVQMLGEYSFLLTFFFIGQTCTTAGLHILLTREAARARERAGAHFIAACAIGALAVLVFNLALLPVFAWSVSGTALRWALVPMGLALLPTAIQTFGESILLAFEHAEDFVVISLVESVLRAVVGAVLVYLGYGILAIAISFFAFRAVVALAITWAIERRGARLSMAVDRSLARALGRQVPVVGAIPVVNALYWRADTLLLTWLRGLVDVGYYGASTRLLDVTRSVPQAYARAVYPVLSRLRDEQPAEFSRLVRGSLVGIAAATIPISLVLSGLAEPLVRLLYGANLAPAAAGLAIVAWVVVPYALTNTLAQILFATGNQAFDLRVNVIATIANVALNLLLIPRWGFVGASLAAVASITLHATLQYRYVRANVEDPRVVQPFLWMAMTAAAAVALMLATAAHHPVLAAAAGLACYGAGLWASGIVGRDHVRWLSREAASQLRRMSGRLVIRPSLSSSGDDV